MGMAFILGIKKGMTQLFQDDKVLGATVVEAGPCLIIDLKTKEKDDHQAVKVAFGKKKNINKPLLGQIKDFDIKPRWVREFKIKVRPQSDSDLGSEKEKFEIGDIIEVDSFKEGENVDVEGFSIGKGFQGVVKRHGFRGKNSTHGTKHDQRMPGSIGTTGPQRVFKGKKMGGRMGGEKKTIKNLEILKIEPEKNLLYLKGAVPGKRNTLLKIMSKV